MKTALTIAGSDSSGGAGIQADLKTMIAHGIYGMSAVTALTAQNTCGVLQVLEVPAPFLAKQLDAVFQDIVPDAVKIGMTGSAELIETIRERLTFYGANHIVLDPVMVSTSGHALIDTEGVSALQRLLPLAEVVTPNLPEAEQLAHRKIQTRGDMETAAKQIYEDYGCAVLCKGGHRSEDADDLLYDRGTIRWYRGERIDNPNTHGTGCTLSSAIASNLAKGMDLQKAADCARIYIRQAISAGLNLGKGRGPLNHAFFLSEKTDWEETT